MANFSGESGIPDFEGAASMDYHRPGRGRVLAAGALAGLLLVVGCSGDSQGDPQPVATTAADQAPTTDPTILDQTSTTAAEDTTEDEDTTGEEVDTPLTLEGLFAQTEPFVQHVIDNPVNGSDMAELAVPVSTSNGIYADTGPVPVLTDQNELATRYQDLLASMLQPTPDPETEEPSFSESNQAFVDQLSSPDALTDISPASVDGAGSVCEVDVPVVNEEGTQQYLANLAGAFGEARGILWPDLCSNPDPEAGLLEDLAKLPERNYGGAVATLERYDPIDNSALIVETETGPVAAGSSESGGSVYYDGKEVGDNRCVASTIIATPKANFKRTDAEIMFKPGDFSDKGFDCNYLRAKAENALGTNTGPQLGEEVVVFALPEFKPEDN